MNDQTGSGRRLGRRELFLALLVGSALAGVAMAQPRRGEIVFRDVKAQTAQFMEWERTIRLTPQQEAVKKEALSSIPAPCCSDNSAYTCCCPCNMSRSVWGLSNYMIAKQGAKAAAVRAKAQEWIAFIQPNKTSGRACYTGRCARPFKDDGCGGMDPSKVNF
mgnify:CR=1 FL=1